MKLRYWILIIASAVVLPLVAILLITRVFITPHKSWWIFGGALIFYFVVGLIAGIMFLVLKLKVKKEPKIELEPKDAREKAVFELLCDNDNPDNYIISEPRIVRTGQPGHTRTPIYWLHGKGSEKNEVIDALINLANPKGEITWLRNKTEKQVLEAIRVMAEMPENEVREERSIGIDEYGRPTTKITTTRQSIAEIKLDEEKKEAEESNII